MLELYFTQIDTVNLTRGQISNAESRMGKELLAYTLKAFHGIGVLPPIDISESGKPFFADHSFEFNISHSHGRVVLALSDKPVGVDIECVKPRRAGIERRILTGIGAQTLF